jgi:CRISPR-associated protein Cas6/Cse3/CasE subtype I-E
VNELKDMFVRKMVVGPQAWGRHNLDNPNAHKGMIWHLFDHHHLPDDAEGWNFRVDESGENRVFCILSRYAPQINPNKFGDMIIDVKHIKDPAKNFAKGTRIPFRVRVNPVTRINDRRVPKKTEEVPDWVAKQFNGIAKCACKVEKVGVQISYKGNQTITHHCVDVIGLLEIEDSELFVALLTKGIGHAKRYGFGLIILG